MIYIISLVMLMVGLISGSVLVTMGPNVSNIVEKDLTQKALNNNELYALQFGDMAVRSRAVIFDSCSNVIPSVDSLIPLDFGSLYRRDNEIIVNTTASIHACQGPLGVVIIPVINQTQQNYTDFF